jgi:hypothetical protein
MVEVRCSSDRRCLVVSFHPIPAHGPLRQVAMWQRAARYRPVMASQLRPEDPSPDDAWVSLPERAQVFTEPAEISINTVHSSTWACRCGLGTLDLSEVVSECYAWLASRKQDRPTRARVMRLT